MDGSADPSLPALHAHAKRYARQFEAIADVANDFTAMTCETRPAPAALAQELARLATDARRDFLLTGSRGASWGGVVLAEMLVRLTKLYVFAHGLERDPRAVCGPDDPAQHCATLLPAIRSCIKFVSDEIADFARALVQSEDGVAQIIRADLQAISDARGLDSLERDRRMAQDLRDQEVKARRTDKAHRAAADRAHRAERARQAVAAELAALAARRSEGPDADPAGFTTITFAGAAGTTGITGAADTASTASTASTTGAANAGATADPAGASVPSTMSISDLVALMRATGEPVSDHPVDRPGETPRVSPRSLWAEREAHRLRHGVFVDAEVGDSGSGSSVGKDDDSDSDGEDEEDLTEVVVHGVHGTVSAPNPGDKGCGTEKGGV